MAEKEEFEGDHLTSGTSFSQLLFGDDDGDKDNDNGIAVGLGVDQTVGYSSVFPIDKTSVFPIGKTPRMLCFGDYENEGEQLLLSETNGTPPKSVITSSDSSSPSSCNRSFNSSFKSNNKKRNESGQELVQCMKRVPMAAGTQKPPKKTKADNPTSTGHPQRKEKLGERIAALQQLVSPFGKTDTASVLHEAMGYIRFLQDQVQLLCSPYLQPHHHHNHKLKGKGDAKTGGGGEEESEKNLRSRGLCLIPVECTLLVANSNGADFWSPAMGIHENKNVSSSTTKQQTIKRR